MKRKIIVYILTTYNLISGTDAHHSIISLDNSLNELRQALRAASFGYELSPQEQFEYNFLMLECSKIAEHFAGLGAMRSSGFYNTLFNYLKSIGTRAAYNALLGQVRAGRLPESYLKRFYS